MLFKVRQMLIEKLGMERFLEIFPVGLIIAILSAALLQNPKILPARQ